MAWLHSLVGELRSHKPCGSAEKKEKKKEAGSKLEGLSSGVGKTKPGKGLRQDTQAWQYLWVGAEEQCPALLCVELGMKH